jgi:hypothetical protein
MSIESQGTHFIDVYILPVTSHSLIFGTDNGTVATDFANSKPLPQENLLLEHTPCRPIVT